MTISPVQQFLQVLQYYTILYPRKHSLTVMMFSVFCFTMNTFLYKDNASYFHLIIFQITYKYILYTM